MSYNSKNNIKNVCIMGVGGVGGFFGGKIAYKISQDRINTKKVYFIARGEHLQKIQSEGLILNTVEQQNMVCRPSLATDNIAEIPSPDLCLLCVKSYDLENAVSSLKQQITGDTIIIPLLNGIDIYDRIRVQLRKGIVLPACVYVGTHIEKPGMVSQVGGGGVILCGKDPEFPNWEPKGLVEFFNVMKIPFQWKEDSFPAIWEKFVFIAAYALVTASLGKTVGAVYADDAAKESVRRIMNEIVAIAEKQGVHLSPSIVEDSIAKANHFRFETKTSYQRDIEQKGRRNEGDLFGDAILRLGEKFDIPIPETRMVYSRIQERLESEKDF